MPTIETITEMVMKRLKLRENHRAIIRKRVATTAAGIMRGSPGTKEKHALLFLQRNVDYVTKKYPDAGLERILWYAERPDKKLTEAEIKTGIAHKKPRLQKTARRRL